MNTQNEIIEYKKGDVNELIDISDYNKITTLNLSEESNKMKLYNALQQCDGKIFDMIGEVINIADVFIEKKEVAKRDENDDLIINEKTGEIEVKNIYRCIIFDDNGKSYVSTAYGIYNSLRQLISIWGYPSLDNILKVKITTRSINNSNKKSLILLINE